MLRKLVPSSGDQDQLAAFVDRLPIGLIASVAELKSYAILFCDSKGQIKYPGREI